MGRYDVPDREAYFERWSDLHLGYDPRGAFWPRTWLTLSYHCARPLARRGIPPALVTVAGGLVSGLVPVAAWRGSWWVLAGAVLVVASGLLDTLDGAVAALTNRATATGYVLDSMVDRISDGCYLLALWLLGAPAWLCLLGGVVTMFQEYLRARAGNAGLGELAVVTVAERPTRVLLTAVTMSGAAIVPAASVEMAAVLGAWAWLGLSMLSFVQLTGAMCRFLRGD